ncbi:TPA: hypothetical protein DEP96_02530 [Candidatus Uhrbacteria bacterium]|nr:hypothetical protein [Candidatus Uhrbacteria bacterium]
MRTELFVNGERYHVYNRGTAKCPIFLDDEDKYKFLWNLHKFQCSKLGKPIIAVSSYCLMTNHFHLSLLQMADGGVSAYVNHVCMSYSLYFNKKYKRTGCLFAGRFKTKHINNDAYFLHLTRYIHRNPIDIVRGHSLESYPWSSYPTYLGLTESPIVTDKLAINILEDKHQYKKFMNAWDPTEDLIISDYTIDDSD